MTERDHMAEWTVAGALRVERMLPVLETTDMPFLDDMRRVVVARGRDPVADVASVVARLDSWYEDVGDPQNSDLPIYLQVKAVETLFAVAGLGEEDEEEIQAAIEFGPQIFWGTCDEFVNENEGYSLPGIAGIKTTLLGVEEIWQERDWAVIRSGVSVAEAFDRQRNKILAAASRRRQVALAIAHCGGWRLLPPPTES